MRLRAAAIQSLEAVLTGSPASFDALSAAYERIRAEVAEAAPDEMRAEFERLFPRTIPRDQAKGGSLHPRIEMYKQEVSSTARTLLGQLAGWLGGLIDAAQAEERMRLEADAYARERVKVEREQRFQS
jgi:hypothetical protein